MNRLALALFGFAALCWLALSTLNSQTANDPVSAEAKQVEVQDQVAVLPPTPPEVAPPETEPLPQVPPTLDRQVQVKSGDILMKILTKNGIDRSEAHAAIVAMGKVYDPRKLRVGQVITLTYGEQITSDDDRPFVALSFQPGPAKDILVERNGDKKFSARAVERALETRDATARGIIETSLYNAAVDAGMPINVLMDLIQTYSFDVDFQREIQTGDKFEALFEREYDELGQPVREGEILYASMTLSGKKLEYYRYTPKSGVTDYFNPKGQSVRKTLMRTPVNGARLSSRYGKRRHPILGYTKMHRGADFAAPSGTPIMAAGDGVIEYSGYNGSYGKYVRIRHNSTYKTAYAHMRKISSKGRKGKRVKQGDIIGYIGTTGRSTGPHLHYEVLVNGKRTNPHGVKLPAGEKLKGKDLDKFKTIRRKIDERYANARQAEERKLARR